MMVMIEDEAIDDAIAKEEHPSLFTAMVYFKSPLGTINTRDFLWLWFAPFDQVASLVTSKVPEWKAIAITRAKFAS